VDGLLISIGTGGGDTCSSRRPAAAVVVLVDAAVVVVVTTPREEAEGDGSLNRATISASRADGTSVTRTRNPGSDG